MTTRLTTPGDRVVIGLALILVILLYGVYRPPSASGDRLEYSTPHRHETLSLNQDQILEVNGSLGTSRIEIRDGAARFLDSPCRNQYCIHSGWLEQEGDFAACLPNRITLLVQADRQQSYDAINY